MESYFKRNFEPSQNLVLKFLSSEDFSLDSLFFFLISGRIVCQYNGNNLTLKAFWNLTFQHFQHVCRP